MFSSGTFQRYLYEIESTQKRLRALYERITEQASDEQVRNRLSGFVRQLENEQQMLQRIREMLPA